MHTQGRKAMLRHLFATTTILLGAFLVCSLPGVCQAFLSPAGTSTTTTTTRRSNRQVSTSAAIRRSTPPVHQAAKQLIEFQEPTTGVTVKLIGCMHYNPASIRLTTDTIDELAREGKLGAVIIESCDIRWEKTTALPETIQNLLQSEMKAACELAMRDEYQRPVVLGDQRINITVSSLGQGLKEAVLDLATPWNGGWGRLIGNVTAAKEEALPSGDNYLDLFAFFDPQLLLAAPVSLVKYPLSFLFRSPVPTLALFTLLFLSEQPTADAAQLVVPMDQMTLNDWIGNLATSTVEIALFARIFLKELLVQRNKILARNILEQCKLYQKGGGSGGTVGATPFSFFGSRNSNKAMPEDDPFEIVYVKGAEPKAQRTQKTLNDKGEEMAVVAVLGMAHCNGIAELLCTNNKNVNKL